MQIQMTLEYDKYSAKDKKAELQAFIDAVKLTFTDVFQDNGDAVKHVSFWYSAEAYDEAASVKEEGA